MNSLQTKPLEQWIAFGKKFNKQLLFFQGFCLDLTSFKYLHPGGSQVIKNYLFKDITDILFTVFPHNRITAPKILEKYKIGKLNQPPVQRMRKTGTILKQRRDEKENSLMKKSVNFPVQIRKLASQKQHMQQMKQSVMRNSKKGLKNSNNGSIYSQNKSKRTKNINKDYLQVLKGSKNEQNKFLQQNERNRRSNEIQKSKQQLNFKQFDSGEQLGNNKEQEIKLQSKTQISIKNYIKESWESFSQFIEESIPIIKVPVLIVKFNTIW